jgi:hypothetical protein
VATMFIRHKVADYGAWRAQYDAFDAERQELGVTGHGVYQLDGDPNDLTIYHDFASLEKAKAFAASARLREVMQAAGVRGAPEVWFTNRV